MIIPRLRRRRRQLVTKFAADGPSQQDSSAITREDNSRSHSNFVWVDRPSAERAQVSLECIGDRLVRESFANFESIVRVAGAPPGRVGGRVDSSVENLPRFRAQIPVWP